jgi:Immunoglobulin-like domain of bacterial spore germination
MDPMTARTRLAALFALLPVLVVLAGCNDDDEPSAQDPNDPAPSSSTPADPSPSSSSGEPSPSDTAGPARVAAPIYFVGDTPQGPRLFREFQQVEADNPADEALAILSGGAADDPDYGSLLPGGQLRLAAYDELASVTVPEEARDRPGDMSSKDVKLAVQQVVYTVQGVLQKRIPVGFVTEDGDSTTFLGLSTPTGGFQAAAQNNVLALVNVTQPQENSEPGATFMASGVANSFEATVPWQVLDANGNKVLDGFATAEGWGDHLYPWESEVDASGLAPGTYTFVAMTDDPSGGEGGGPTEDTKTFTLH